MNPFKNGNRRIARLTIGKLAAAAFVSVLSYIVGNLPSWDFLTLKEMKVTSAAIGLLLMLTKSAEMFFDKTVSMFKNHEISDDEETVITQTKSTTVATKTAAIDSAEVSK